MSYVYSMLTTGVCQCDDVDGQHTEIEQGVPDGCTDYKMEGGKLVPSESEEDWRYSRKIWCSIDMT